MQPSAGNACAVIERVDVAAVAHAARVRLDWTRAIAREPRAPQQIGSSLFALLRLIAICIHVAHSRSAQFALPIPKGRANSVERECGFANAAGFQIAVAALGRELLISAPTLAA